MKLLEEKDLMTEWDYEKNDPIGLFPDKLATGCNKRA